MIKYIKINWFRCYDNFELDFKPWMNLIVWENDSGKSSLLDVFNILKWNKQIDKDDFMYGKNNIEFEIKLDEDIFKIKKEINSDLKIFQILNITIILNLLELSALDEDTIKYYLKILWETTSWNKESKLKSKLESYTNEIEEIEIESKILYQIMWFTKFEDWKTFTNIQDDFKSFIKSDVSNIWDEVSWTKKISEIIADKLNDIKLSKEAEYSTVLLPTIKEILPDITGMNIELESDLWNFNWYKSKIGFSCWWNNINIQKKWDWTRRRISLALFKHESLKNSDDINTYLFDEPDTHLNLRVQQDLINTFWKLCENGHQVIFTSHSPFILNLVPLSNIIILKNNWAKTDKIEQDLTSPDEFYESIYHLWIQNVDIFFSKYFLFMEWATEEQFFSKAYYKKYLEPIEKKFIKQINCKGISNEWIFMDNFCSIIWDWIKIISIVDNDYTDDSKVTNIINKLNTKFLPTWNFKLYTLWIREFEDLFESSDIFNCFNEECTTNNITESDITSWKDWTCKYSSMLQNKLKIKKPEIWRRLANYLNFDDLPQQIKEILSYINSL